MDGCVFNFEMKILFLLRRLSTRLMRKVDFLRGLSDLHFISFFPFFHFRTHQSNFMTFRGESIHYRKAGWKQKQFFNFCPTRTFRFYTQPTHTLGGNFFFRKSFFPFRKCRKIIKMSRKSSQITSNSLHFNWIRFQVG